MSPNSSGHEELLTGGDTAVVFTRVTVTTVFSFFFDCTPAFLRLACGRCGDRVCSAPAGDPPGARRGGGLGEQNGQFPLDFSSFLWTYSPPELGPAARSDTAERVLKGRPH